MAAKRKAKTHPPQHEGEELKIRLDVNLDEALYLNGIWVSPGEEAYVAAADARKLVKDGQAVQVDD